jgi:nucleoside-diphosphate-sugar epimerase
MNKILITGGMSFIGRHLVQSLTNTEIQLIVTYKNINQNLILLQDKNNTNIEWIQLDITKEEDFLKLPSNIDVIIHVAGISVTEKVSIDEMLKTNVIGIRNLQKYALRARANKFIYTSSLSIHGKINEDVVNENTPINDPDAYGISKYLGERLLAETADVVPAVAIRLPGVIGLGAHRAWLPTLVDKMKRNEEIYIYNPNTYFNNAIHVSDLNLLIRKIVNKNAYTGFAAFPVGASDKIKVIEIANTLKKELNSKSQFKIVDALKSSFLIDSKIAELKFEYEPKNIKLLIEKYAKET